MLEARSLRWPELAVLDLFAGSGSLAFEAASRGARYVCLVESSADIVRRLEANAHALGLAPPRCRIVRDDVIRLLAHSAGRREHPLLTEAGGAFDVVFLDPPYGKSLVPAALRRLADEGWLAPGAYVAAETEANAAPEEDFFGEGRLVRRVYGQTLISLWQRGAA